MKVLNHLLVTLAILFVLSTPPWPLLCTLKK